ncbi:MAG: hypothetical protein NVSMB51_18530 [Solirubrobacteraceae bacterium]
MRKSIPTLLAGGLLLLLAAAPAAEASVGGAIAGGLRNPGSSTGSAYSRETQIIANVGAGQGGVAPGTGGFATRQSNKSTSGGGAIYGCRATSGTNPCLESVNLASGSAFQFFAAPTSSTIGAFLFGSNPTTTVAQAPFTTNGTGVVKNLNADALGGKHAADFVGTAQLLYAVVDDTGKLGNTRGASAASLQAGASKPTFAVTFGSTDVSRCAYTANPTSTTAGTLAVSPGTDGKSVKVTESGSTASGFHLQVTC